MPIIFPNRTISGTGNYVNIPGSIIQVVDNTATVSGTTNTTSWVDTLSTTITIADPNSKILVEYFMNDRSDQGNGTWSLIYHRILRNGTQVMHSGYNGAQANHIGYYSRSFFDTPGAGTWTYVSSFLAHQGTCSIGTSSSGSSQHYLRLYEIGQ
jgi:hypothetical protein